MCALMNVISRGFRLGGGPMMAAVMSGDRALCLAAELIRRFEGLILYPYLCPAGRLTIGYGHVILPGEDLLRRGIDRAAADDLLQADIAWALAEARAVGVALTDYQAAALASLIYNIGAGAWRGSTIRRKVAAGDMAGAALEFARWNKGGGKVLAGLVERRAIEADVFLRGAGR
jgi:lysozyme